MERISNKREVDFPSATLYLDDVIEIVDRFSKTCAHLEIRSGQYKITEPMELAALADKFPNGKFDNLTIRGQRPAVSLELRSFGAETYISEDTLEQRVVVASVREVLQRCRKTSGENLALLGGLLLFGLTGWVASHKWFYAAYPLGIAGFAMLSLSLTFRMKYTVVVYTKHRADAKSFFHRKKDDVLLVVISAGVSAALTYATTKLLP